MNKKILSLAIAAAMAAPLVAQADVTVYGMVNMDVSNVNTHTADDYFTWPVGTIWSTPSVNCCRSFPASRPGRFHLYQSDNSWEANSNNSRLGFKGSEDLGNGLSAIWGMEFGVDIMGDRSLGINHNVVNGSSDDITTRNMFLGLSSAPFGTVLAGKHDHPYKVMFGSWDKFAETMADDDQIMKGAAPARTLITEFNGQDTQGFADRRGSNAIAYISPTMGGVTLAGATVLAELNSDDGVFTDTAGYSLAASGDWGPIKGALGYENLNDLNANKSIDTGVPGLGLWDNWLTVNWMPYIDKRFRDDDTLWGAAIAFDSNPFYVGLRYEDRSGVDYIKDYDMKQWRLTATYTFGNNVVKALYHRLDGSTPSYAWGGDYTGDAWAVGIDHNFSKRTKLYALYTHLTWNIDSNTGQGRLNMLPLVGGSGAGGALVGFPAFAGFGQPSLMDNETFGIGMQHLF